MKSFPAFWEIMLLLTLKRHDVAKNFFDKTELNFSGSGTGIETFPEPQ
jgi:hypothetical protein